MKTLKGEIVTVYIGASVKTVGKHVSSTDPRKPHIVTLFKELTGCHKVTLLRETMPQTFQAHCLKYAGHKYDSMGYFCLYEEIEG